MKWCRDISEYKISLNKYALTFVREINQFAVAVHARTWKKDNIQICQAMLHNVRKVFVLPQSLIPSMTLCCDYSIDPKLPLGPLFPWGLLKKDLIPFNYGRFNLNSNSIEISFHDHLDFNTVIAKKIVHGTTALLLMASNGITQSKFPFNLNCRGQ